MSAEVTSGSLIRTQRLRAIGASTVGTTIEWYDYFLYGTMPALLLMPRRPAETAPSEFDEAADRLKAEEGVGARA
jgi:hypothetical protein